MREPLTRIQRSSRSFEQRPWDGSPGILKLRGDLLGAQLNGHISAQQLCRVCPSRSAPEQLNWGAHLRSVSLSIRPSVHQSAPLLDKQSRMHRRPPSCAPRLTSTISEPVFEPVYGMAPKVDASCVLFEKCVADRVPERLPG